MNFPTSPIEQHKRFMAAFTDDLLAGDRNYSRAKTVLCIVRKIRKEGCAIAASGTVATRASPRAGSRLGHSASVNYREGCEQ